MRAIVIIDDDSTALAEALDALRAAMVSV